jgi:hypothetical protein
MAFKDAVVRATDRHDEAPAGAPDRNGATS